MLSRDAWRDLLAADFPGFLGAAFLFSVSALVNDGVFDPAWLGQPNFRDIVSVLPADMIMDVFLTVFADDFDVVRDRARSTTPHLGKIVEIYVGEQLDLLCPPGIRTGEIEYSTGQLGVDHILQLPEFAVLIEVKSARVAQPGRLDLDGYLADARRDVGKALRQIDYTAGLIRAGHDAFHAISPRTSLRGLVVTAEPHYLLNSPLFRDQLGRTSLPTTVLSLSELEKLVGIARATNIASILLESPASDRD